MDTQRKLEILADSSQYDLACACGTKDQDRRKRSSEGTWLYPVSLPGGGKSILLKTLLSSVCVNDCKYCPFRSNRDVRRCTLKAEEIARIFMDYVRRKGIFGLFLSSGVIRNPDFTMDRMGAVARILRKQYQYRGYIHLKIIPGASDAAIEEIISLASAVSLNVETPRRSAMKQLSDQKDYDRDIVRSVKKISELTAPGSAYSRVSQTTQFIVGAADERDSEIVRATFGLYRRWRLNRVYFSAYQRGLGDSSLPGERHPVGDPGNLLTREHRLYQADWLMRKYGFADDEIPFEADGNLSLQVDPKEAWARRHPEVFPMDVNRAGKFELLRVPGLGTVSVGRIMKMRTGGGKVRSIRQLGRYGKRLEKAAGYLKFGY